jgi:hypothetical protein
MTGTICARLTLAEANRRLPLIRAIVRDAMNARNHAEILHRVTEELAGTRPCLQVVVQRDVVADELDRWLKRMDACTTELERLGGQLLDLSSGEVRFPGIVNDEPATLIWRYGELRFKARGDTSARQDASECVAA